jgi:hypothetical protein
MAISPLPSVYRCPLPLTQLATAELFVVCVLRLWVAPIRGPKALHPDWRDGFFAAGIERTAVPAFDALFRIFKAAARRPLDIRTPSGRYLGADEAWILQAIGSLQSGREVEAAMIFAGWLPPAAVRMALVPARGLSAALAGAGLTMPLQSREAATVWNVSAYPDRGLSLVQ